MDRAVDNLLRRRGVILLSRLQCNGPFGLGRVIHVDVKQFARAPSGRRSSTQTVASRAGRYTPDRPAETAAGKTANRALGHSVDGRVAGRRNGILPEHPIAQESFGRGTADRYGFHGSGRHGRSEIDGAGEWLRGGAQLRVVAGAAHYWQPVGLQPRRRSGWQRRWHG